LPFEDRRGRHYRIKVTLRTALDSIPNQAVGFTVEALDLKGVVGAGLLREIPTGALVRTAINVWVRQQIEAAEQQRDEGLAPETVADLTLGFDGVEEYHWDPTPDDLGRWSIEHERYWQARTEELRKRLIVTGKGPGRRYGPETLQVVADIVDDARRRGEPASPAVMQVFEIKRGAAESLIGRARQQGLIT
jgi:hypothetical protein